MNEPGPRVAAIVLAAGRSCRMGEVNKLLANVNGKPLVAHAADAAVTAGAAPVVVVLGHEAEAVRSALAGRPLRFVDNPHFREGMAASLRAGVAALAAETEAALVCLGDMPAVTAMHLRLLMAAFAARRGCAACVPVHDGKRGHPVLLGRKLFPEIAGLSGDIGARQLLVAHAGEVYEVAMPDAGILLDVDTPDALAGLD